MRVAVVVSDLAKTKVASVLGRALGLEMANETRGPYFTRSTWFRNDAMTLEICEVPMLSGLRRLAGRDPCGVLAAVTRRDEDRWPLQMRFPSIDVGGPAPKERFVREIVVSSLDAETEALALRRRALKHGAQTTRAPGVLRCRNFDLRLQPVRRSALVFQSPNIDDTAETFARNAVPFQRLGRSGSDRGHLLLDVPWTGLEFRFSDRIGEPAAPFYEAHTLFTDPSSPDVVPELQSPFLAGSSFDAGSPPRGEKAPPPPPQSGGDCWMEARAMFARPLNFLRS